MALSPTAADHLRVRVHARRDLPDPADRRPIREAAGISLGDLAAALGVSRQAVNQWERGIREPRGELLIRYAEAVRIMREAEPA